MSRSRERHVSTSIRHPTHITYSRDVRLLPLRLHLLFTASRWLSGAPHKVPWPHLPCGLWSTITSDGLPHSPPLLTAKSVETEKKDICFLTGHRRTSIIPSSCIGRHPGGMFRIVIPRSLLRGCLSIPPTLLPCSQSAEGARGKYCICPTEPVIPPTGPSPAHNLRLGRRVRH